MLPKFLGVFFIPIIYLIPAVILYFIIKLAVKHALKELRDENIL